MVWGKPAEAILDIYEQILRHEQKAPFTHPAPGTRTLLKTFYPRVEDTDDKHIITPSLYGEMLAEVHDRVAYAMMGIIHRLDQEEGVKTLLICAHAATVIAIGRALTGRESDFTKYTYGC